MNIATPPGMAMATAVSASCINAGARRSMWCCPSNTRPARKPSWTRPARPCRSATVTPARYGRRPCSSPRSAPVPTPGRRSRDQQMESWLLAHVHALEHWGGVPFLVVPDNTKTGVTRPCRYDPDVNPTYQNFAAHYGFGVLPARPYQPRDKAVVENAVQVAQRWILAALRHRKFFSLVEANQTIGELLHRINHRPFRK